MLTPTAPASSGLCVLVSNPHLGLPLDLEGPASSKAEMVSLLSLEPVPPPKLLLGAQAPSKPCCPSGLKPAYSSSSADLLSPPGSFLPFPLSPLPSPCFPAQPPPSRKLSAHTPISPSQGCLGTRAKWRAQEAGCQGGCNWWSLL